MSTIRPKTPCYIVSHIEQFDGHGRVKLKATRKRTKCAIVSLYDAAGKTTVRADSSASRGRAEEHLSDARLLFKPNVEIKIGDVVVIPVKGGDSVSIKITSIFRRPDIEGAIHHIDVEGDRWASE